VPKQSEILSRIQNLAKLPETDYSTLVTPCRGIAFYPESKADTVFAELVSDRKMPRQDVVGGVTKG
jgi:hypothetical protein